MHDAPGCICHQVAACMQVVNFMYMQKLSLIYGECIRNLEPGPKALLQVKHGIGSYFLRHLLWKKVVASNKKLQSQALNLRPDPSLGESYAKIFFFRPCFTLTQHFLLGSQ